MELHHSKHHMAYITNFLNGIKSYDLALQKNDIPSLGLAMKNIWFNAGGHVNHSIFWGNLSPISAHGGKIDVDSPVCMALIKKFGSVVNFKSLFNQKTAAVQGSGWGWLVYHPLEGLSIKTTQNQDMVSVIYEGCTPLLGIDVWEHAYYLKYENRRPEYLSEIWKVVNWKDIDRRYNEVVNK